VPGFQRLKVTGYRRLAALDLPLAPMNVLVGANGVGKSSILDVLALLAAAADRSLEFAISDRGGIDSILTADGHAASLELDVSAQFDTGPPLDYHLRLARQGYGYVIADESLIRRDDPPAAPFRYIDASGPVVRYHHASGTIEPDWDYKPRETALSQIPHMYREGEAFRERCSRIDGIYHELDTLTQAAVRRPQKLLPAQTPGADGEVLLPCLYNLRETAPDRFEAILDALRVAFPGFDRLEFPVAAAGLITLGWRERGLTRPIYANELSEGTLRFLWLATLLQCPGLGEVTLIDEPEVSLHPEMLRLLVELMREATSRTQLVVATHSDRLVRFLEPSELVVCDRDDAGAMTATRADSIDLSGWLGEYTLDQLWAMGRVGGRS
jgi:predicted ATPase